MVNSLKRNLCYKVKYKSNNYLYQFDIIITNMNTTSTTRHTYSDMNAIVIVIITMSRETSAQ